MTDDLSRLIEQTAAEDLQAITDALNEIANEVERKQGEVDDRWMRMYGKHPRVNQCYQCLNSILKGQDKK